MALEIYSFIGTMNSLYTMSELGFQTMSSECKQHPRKRVSQLACPYCILHLKCGISKTGFLKQEKDCYCWGHTIAPSSQNLVWRARWSANHESASPKLQYSTAKPWVGFTFQHSPRKYQLSSIFVVQWRHLRASAWAQTFLFIAPIEIGSTQAEALRPPRRKSYFPLFNFKD